MKKCPKCGYNPPKKAKLDTHTLYGTEKLQYALDNFAGILKNVEYFEHNYEQIKTQLTDFVQLALTGYFTALGSLIRNRDGMDYTKIFELCDLLLKKNVNYPKQNEALKHNIDVLREWEASLKYEMKHILEVRDKHFAHIDFVDMNFLIESFVNKDTTKQNDLSKFVRSLIDTAQNYSLSVCKQYAQNNS